jgi:hypothetical protein
MKRQRLLLEGHLWVSFLTWIKSRVNSSRNDILENTLDSCFRRNDIVGLLNDIVGLLKGIVGLLKGIVGLLKDIVGLLKDIVGCHS